MEWKASISCGYDGPEPTLSTAHRASPKIASGIQAVTANEHEGNFSSCKLRGDALCKVAMATIARAFGSRVGRRETGPTKRTSPSEGRCVVQDPIDCTAAMRASGQVGTSLRGITDCKEIDP